MKITTKRLAISVLAGLLSFNCATTNTFSRKNASLSTPLVDQNLKTRIDIILQRLQNAKEAINSLPDAIPTRFGLKLNYFDIGKILRLISHFQEILRSYDVATASTLSLKYMRTGDLSEVLVGATVFDLLLAGNPEERDAMIKHFIISYCDEASLIIATICASNNSQLSIVSLHHLSLFAKREEVRNAAEHVIKRLRIIIIPIPIPDEKPIKIEQNPVKFI